MPAAKRLGVKDVRHLTNPLYWRHPVHPTFHGRDLFAPVAAHLTLGAKVVDLGPSVHDPVDLDFGKPERTADGLRATVLHVDRFGTVVTNVRGADAEARWPYGDTARVLAPAGEFALTFLRAYGFAPKGALLLTIGSHGFLEVAANGDDAAKVTGLRAGDSVTLRES
jgi:S-adenosylmethionine hydrolase